MDLITIVVILFLTALPLVINDSWIMKVLLCFVPFIIGLFVLIDGVTFNSSTILESGSNVYTLTVFVFLTLGSLVSMYSASVKKDVDVK